jgi:xanthine dehydrogenase accessory factor
MMRTELLHRVQRLVADGEPFVLATVVQARRPTSVRPGDAAVVRADGTIEGFIGGVCATSSVRLQSLRALETGEALLLRLVPDDGEGDGDAAFGDAVFGAGAIVERNPCLSGGALEIFLEPHLPAARLVVVGDSPIAHALQRVAAAAGFDCALVAPGGAMRVVDVVDGAAAVVVSSHGSDEEAVLAAALEAGVGYVALVASETRGSAVRAELPIPDELRGQLRTPAGLDIGARGPEEVAISILAELVARRHAHPVPPTPAGEVVVPAPSRVQVADDPVCGMRVAITAATPQLGVGEDVAYFCSEGCRNRYATEHSDAVPR